VKYNPHINNVGEIARVDAEGDDWLQVVTAKGGVGAVDKDAVEDVDFDTLPPDQRYELTMAIGTEL